MKITKIPSTQNQICNLVLEIWDLIVLSNLLFQPVLELQERYSVTRAYLVDLNFKFGILITNSKVDR